MSEPRLNVGRPPASTSPNWGTWGSASPRWWWAQEDHWEWTTDFLESRGLLKSTKRMVTILAISTMLAPIVLIPSWHELSVWGRTFIVASFICSIVDGLFWATSSWPDRRSSAFFVVLGSLIIVGWTLVQPNAALALLGCAAMTISGGYIAYFHSVKLMTVNLILALVAIGFATARVADRDPTLAVGAFWLTFLMVLFVPGCIRAIARAVHSGESHSHRDELTQVLNRRGLFEAVRVRNRAGELAGERVTAILVDLDRFKVLNDSRGHSAGDRALVNVARALLYAVPDAIMCRFGGEEFVILQIPSFEDSSVAERIRAAIAALDDGVTASVGVATMTISGDGVAQDVAVLLAKADDAMYIAKRNGGNQVHLAHP